MEWNCLFRTQKRRTKLANRKILMMWSVVLLLLVKVAVASRSLDACLATVRTSLADNWGDTAMHYRGFICSDELSDRDALNYRKGFERVVSSFVGAQVTIPLFNVTTAMGSVPADKAKYRRICNYLEAFALGSGCESQNHTKTQRRRLQDTSCPLDLLDWVQEDDDEQLTLAEYNVFFRNRYYKRCDLTRIELDQTTGMSNAQSDAFFSLSCLTCLRELGTVTMIPECCQPDKAAISLENPDPYSFSRICAAARAAAAEDCSYLALLTTHQPQSLVPESPLAAPIPTATNTLPVGAPIKGPTPLSRPIALPGSPVTQPSLTLPTQPISECGRQLVLSDNNPADGVLTSSEFSTFLLNRFGQSCVFRQPEASIQGLFLQLSCSSCLSGDSANLDCCLPQVARISISDAYSGRESNWIQRICFNADSQIESVCSFVPLPAPAPIPAPLSAPVPQPIPFPQPPIPAYTRPPMPSAGASPIQPVTMPVSFAPVSPPLFVQQSPSSPPNNSSSAGPSSAVTNTIPPGRHSSMAPVVELPVQIPTTLSPVQPIILTPEPVLVRGDNPPISSPPVTLAPTALPQNGTNITVPTSSSTFTLPPISSPVANSASRRQLSAYFGFIVTGSLFAYNLA